MWTGVPCVLRHLDSRPLSGSSCQGGDTVVPDLFKNEGRFQIGNAPSGLESLQTALTSIGRLFFRGGLPPYADRKSPSFFSRPCCTRPAGAIFTASWARFGATFFVTFDISFSFSRLGELFELSVWHSCAPQAVTFESSQN